MEQLFGRDVVADADPRVDKAKWGPGPWQGEPDRVEWRFGGLPCLITRGNPEIGNLCGYVGLPPGHPWHGVDPDKIDADVHGGLTFASECSGRVCHVARPGEPEHVYWLGFDCAHCWDLMPGVAARCPSLHEFGTYRTVEYVMQQCEDLARQCLAVSQDVVELSSP